MARLIVLDSGPLGLATRSPNRPVVQQCHAWLLKMELAGALIDVPEIADYEVRRELIRAGITSGVRRLDAIKKRFIFLPISTPAMLMAAQLCADARQLGVPTASPESLDADCIVAGQAATVGGLGDSVTIATSNAAHLACFSGVDAREWSTI